MRVLRDVTTHLAWLVLGSLLLSVSAKAQSGAGDPSDLAADAEAPVVDQVSEADLARAQAAFDSGMALVREERWADAEARFAQALEIRWSAPVAANLALAQSHSARLIEALLNIDEILSRPGLAPEIVAMAESLREELQARLAYVIVEAPAQVDGEDLLVTVDGVVAPAGPIALNPGAHEIVARVGERVIGRAPANVAEGQTVRIALGDLTPAAVAHSVPDPEIGPTPETPGTSAPPSRVGRRLGITLAALAVVGVVLALVFTAPYGTPGGQLDGELGTLEVGE